MSKIGPIPPFQLVLKLVSFIYGPEIVLNLRISIFIKSCVINCIISTGPLDHSVIDSVGFELMHKIFIFVAALIKRGFLVFLD